MVCVCLTFRGLSYERVDMETSFFFGMVVDINYVGHVENQGEQVKVKVTEGKLEFIMQLRTMMTK